MADIRPVSGRYEPGTRELLFPTGRTYKGRPVLRARTSGQEFYLKRREPVTSIPSTVMRSAGVATTEFSELPRNCPFCGTSSGVEVMQAFNGTTGEADSEAELEVLYRCKNGHNFRERC